MKAVLTSLLFLAMLTGIAQNKKEQTVEIKTSAVCEMCKETLEYEMALEKGVKSSSLDVESKMLSITFNPKKTSIDLLRSRVIKTGYDADGKLADQKAYDKLPTCCKKDAHQDGKKMKHHGGGH